MPSVAAFASWTRLRSPWGPTSNFPYRRVRCCLTAASETTSSAAIARIDGPIDVEYYLAGGILPAVVRRLANEA